MQNSDRDIIKSATKLLVDIQPGDIQGFAHPAYSDVEAVNCGDVDFQHKKVFLEFIS